MKTTMEAKLKQLQEMELNLELFYNVSFTPHSMKIQGELTGETRKYCEGLGFKFELCDANWITATIDNVTIVLTF